MTTFKGYSSFFPRDENGKLIGVDQELKPASEVYKDITNMSRGWEPIEQMFFNGLRDLNEVTHFGGQKHGYKSWKDADNPSLEHKANCSSMFRHLAAHYAGEELDESGSHHLLHLAWRALAEYERLKQ